MASNRSPSWLWVCVAAAAAAAAIVLVLMSVSGVRVAKQETPSEPATPPSPEPREAEQNPPPSGEKAETSPPRAVAHPGSAPSQDRPIAIWSETTEPIVNLRGDLRLGYEKLPGLDRDTVTVRVVVEMPDQQGEFAPELTLHFHRPVPGQTGQLRLGALLAAVGEQQAVGRQFSGPGRLVITVGKGGRGMHTEYRSLSNEVVVPCRFEKR